MPRRKVKVPKERWKAVRIHEVYYNELLEMCKVLELPLAQCLGHIIHQTYIMSAVQAQLATQEAEKEVTEVARQSAPRQAPQPKQRRRAPLLPPP
jgi:hypothetical protein